jgi:hypothetical protein
MAIQLVMAKVVQSDSGHWIAAFAAMTIERRIAPAQSSPRQFLHTLHGWDHIVMQA